MLLHIVLVTEILGALICVHCLYGEKFRLDDKTVEAFLGILFILEIINVEHLNGIYSLLGYVVLFVYCKAEFDSSVFEATISLVLCIVIVTVIQFICGFFANILRIGVENVRDVMSNMMSLVVFTLLLPTDGLHRLKKSICRHSRFIILLLFFVCLTVMMLLWQGKYSYVVHMQYFVLAVPAIILLLYAVLKWYTAQDETERMREKLCRTEENKKDYETLLTKVRLRQHAFRNHIEAIFSFHYAYKTYEKLVQVEEEYCHQLLKENKYNDLTLIGDYTLGGYLSGKFQEAEEDGIEIDYRIEARIGQCKVPVYYVIEMLGILLDNAMEALKGIAGKRLSFIVREAEGQYEFLIRNPFPYVPYDDIVAWFSLGKSEKGSGRGLGLYQLKCLCEEWNCDFGCRNKEIGEENWIVFYIRVKKADSM